MEPSLILPIGRMKYQCGVGTSAIRKQAIIEFKNAIARSITMIEDNMVVDRNKQIKEKKNTEIEREEALKLMNQTIQELQKRGEFITAESIIESIVNIDLRNRKYATWIKILYDNREETDKQEGEQEL